MHVVRARARVSFVRASVCASSPQASELLFGDAWLFRSARQTDTTELLAMLGQPDTRGAELSIANWDGPEACARELAAPLRCSVADLLSSSETESGEESQEAEESGRVRQRVARTSSYHVELGYLSSSQNRCLLND